VNTMMNLRVSRALGIYRSVERLPASEERRCCMELAERSEFSDPVWRGSALPWSNVIGCLTVKGTNGRGKLCVE
jgi:hypothetical protein